LQSDILKPKLKQHKLLEQESKMPKGIWAYNWVHRSSTFASYYYEINGSTTCKFSLARVQSTCQVVTKRYTAICL